MTVKVTPEDETKIQELSKKIADLLFDHYSGGPMDTWITAEALTDNLCAVLALGRKPEIPPPEFVEKAAARAAYDIKRKLPSSLERVREIMERKDATTH